MPRPGRGGSCPIRSGDFIPDVAVDRSNGNLYAVWMDLRFDGGIALLDHDNIAFSMSTDGGRSWSPAIKVNQTPTDEPNYDQQAFTPAVARGGRRDRDGHVLRLPQQHGSTRRARDRLLRRALPRELREPRRAGPDSETRITPRPRSTSARRRTRAGTSSATTWAWPRPGTTSSPRSARRSRRTTRTSTSAGSAHERSGVHRLVGLGLDELAELLLVHLQVVLGLEVGAEDRAPAPRRWRPAASRRIRCTR